MTDTPATAPSLNYADLLAESRKRGRILIRPSSFSSFIPCARRGYWRHVMGIRLKKEETSEAVSVGSWFHAIMRHTLEVGIDEAVRRCRLEASATASADADKAVASVASDPSDLAPEAATSAADSNSKHLDLAEAMARIFHAKHPPRFSFGAVAFREQPLHARLGRYELEATPDLVYYDSEACGLWIADYKTTGLSLTDALAGREFSAQTLFYPYVVGKNHPAKVLGFVYNYIRRPTIRFCSKDASYAHYVERCRQWYADLEAKNESPMISLVCDFRSMPNPPTTDTLLTLLKRTLPPFSLAPRNRYFDLDAYPCWRDCSTYGRICPYYPLCSHSTVVHNSILPALYVYDPELTEHKEEDSE